ncbi:MAG: DUF333 domain-containing protein [Chloroflexota bacterium]
MLTNRKLIIVTLTLLALLLGACAGQPPAASEAPGAGIANPASENCVAKDGELQIVKRGDLGEYGVCVFEDNLQCEEWAMMRGDCPVGGIKITGYVTQAAVYCAITGGEYAVTANSGEATEKGTCTFKNAKSCDADEYYNGKCTAED